MRFASHLRRAEYEAPSVLGDGTRTLDFTERGFDMADDRDPAAGGSGGHEEGGYAHSREGRREGRREGQPRARPPPHPSSYPRFNKEGDTQAPAAPTTKPRSGACRPVARTASIRVRAGAALHVVRPDGQAQRLRARPGAVYRAAGETADAYIVPLGRAGRLYVEKAGARVVEGRERVALETTRDLARRVAQAPLPPPDAPLPPGLPGGGEPALDMMADLDPEDAADFADAHDVMHGHEPDTDFGDAVERHAARDPDPEPDVAPGWDVGRNSITGQAWRDRHDEHLDTLDLEYSTAHGGMDPRLRGEPLVEGEHYAVGRAANGMYILYSTRAQRGDDVTIERFHREEDALAVFREMEEHMQSKQGPRARGAQKNIDTPDYDPDGERPPRGGLPVDFGVPGPIGQGPSSQSRRSAGARFTRIAVGLWVQDPRPVDRAALAAAYPGLGAGRVALLCRVAEEAAEDEDLAEALLDAVEEVVSEHVEDEETVDEIMDEIAMSPTKDEMVDLLCMTLDADRVDEEDAADEAGDTDAFTLPELEGDEDGLTSPLDRGAELVVIPAMEHLMSAIAAVKDRRLRGLAAAS